MSSQTTYESTCIVLWMHTLNLRKEKKKAASTWQASHCGKQSINWEAPDAQVHDSDVVTERGQGLLQIVCVREIRKEMCRPVNFSSLPLEASAFDWWIVMLTQLILFCTGNVTLLLLRLDKLALMLDFKYSCCTRSYRCHLDQQGCFLPRWTPF